MGTLFELEITAAAKGSREIASHLFRQLRSAILDGRLLPGSRLPSTRAAPDVFGASRNTVQDVYDRLAQEGLVGARHGSGTYVSDTRPKLAAPASPRATSVQGRVNSFWERSEIGSWIGFWQESHESAPGNQIVADLRPALVDQRLFPHAAFRQVMARALRKLEMTPSPSKSPQGNQGNGQLRRAIAEHVSLTRALACGADDVLVTSGAQQGFDLLARTLVTSGETIVAVEDPGYPPIRAPFALAGARIAPVRVDSEGIVIDEIPAGAKVICVCPSHQFPLGMPMSPRRRQALLRFAEQTGAVIVEDDYDGEFRYDGSPIEALRSSASSGHVCYVGSFSKCMFPSLRLGFLVPPRWALPALVAAKNSTDWHCSVPVQAAVARFILDGHLARHIRRVRRIYRDRRGLLLNLLDQRLGQYLTVVPSFYGMHIAALARTRIECEAVSQALSRRGIIIHSLDRFFVGPPGQIGFVIAYAAADSHQLRLAVDALAEEVAELAN
ncbi:PLP-dependent aminotransferase family protein [Sphingomonas sp.]|uniref:MocR-like pyridoxine biosynthesis transcription factor PdxR n=1 Tax=Sphingomonas sp. TaxID=28214 RepID=UPI0038A20578